MFPDPGWVVKQSLEMHEQTSACSRERTEDRVRILPVLAGFACQLDTAREADIREEGASLRKMLPMRSSCKAFSQLVISEPSPWWVVPSLGWWTWVL